ncbi:MAG: tautomerase family protein [Actinomycetota bacterium]|nr:tautomerase family protein [Actinomycetota bacterium]
MPLVQIDLDRSLMARKEDISNKIQEAFVESELGVPANDKFQIFRPHDAGELVADPTYNGVDRRSVTYIHITMVHMYPVEAKNRLYKNIVQRMEECGVRREDLLICIVENGFEDWCAGKLRGE